jgi:hypothetical protein
MFHLIEWSELHEEFIGRGSSEVLVEIAWRKSRPNKSVLNLNGTVVFKVDDDRTKYRGAWWELEFGRGPKIASFRREAVHLG